MTENNTSYEDFDWDADTEELEPYEFRRAYDRANVEYSDSDLYEKTDSFFPQVRLEPEPIGEQKSSSCRGTIPSEKPKGFRSVMLEHFLKFFPNALL